MQRIVSRWSAATLSTILGLATVAASCASASNQTTAGSTAAMAAQASSPTGKPLAILPTSPDLKWGPCPPIFPAGCQIAVLHGDPSQPNADIYLRVPGGYTIPTHTHTSAERMVLTTGKLKVKYKGAKMTTLTVAEYAFGPAGLPHVAKCVSKTPCTLFIAFEGPVDALAFTGTLD
jgi:quercetin dioxygenase-like cupin family protein